MGETCMKPLRLILPALLATPAVVPLVSALAVDRSGSLSVDSISRALLDGDVFGDTPDDASDQARPRPDRQPMASTPTSPAAAPEFPSRTAQQPSIPPARDGWSDAKLGSSGAELASAASGSIRAPGAPRPSTGEVRFGDTLIKIAQRYGLTLNELLRLNPGLETARLVVGTQVRLAQSSPGRSRMLLGLKPVGSGGLSWPELPEYGDRQKDSGNTISGSQWIWPTKGVFTSGYGWRWGRMHKGIDVANNVGTPIVAAREGVVSFSGWSDGGYGYLVEITHPDGSRSLYAHNSQLIARKGDSVQQGQMISRMGSTGRSTGPHLHFEIHPPGRGAGNPMTFLPPRA
jgi:murein DD-endopeptidase MepM/ murein hydrolase activator NlpD